MSSALHDSSEFSSEESCPFITDVKRKTPTKQKHRVQAFYRLQLSFWIFITFVLAISLFITIRRNHSQCQDQYSYENGYETEFRPARQAINVKQIKFTGGLYYENGTLLMSSNPEEPGYVGPPSEEIDNAWEALIHDRYLAITLNQAKEVGGDLLFLEENGLYHAGMDVLHTLHCLNLLRKTQDFDYYFEKGQVQKGSGGRKHVEHCINHIRQIVQCHGDMTPLPVVWAEIKGYPNGGKPIPYFDQVHTCRDFAALRDWSTKHDQKVKQMVMQQLKESHYNTI